MASPPRSSSTSDDAAPAPPPKSSWVILGGIPRVVQDDVDATDATATTDLSLALAAPPLVSHLTVSRRVFPALPTSQNYPILLAADPSGLLLLHSIIDAPAPPARPRTGVDDTDRRERKTCFYDWRLLDPRYLVLDATTGSALRLPNPDPLEHIPHPALVGVVSCPGAGAGAGRYMVAELVPGTLGSGMADLRCYFSDRGEWVTKAVRYPFQRRRLSPICTLAHHGRLWWADYSWGIVTADPFADKPVLRFVTLPGCQLGYGDGWGDLERFRYVGRRQPALRRHLTYRRRDIRDKVSVWTLADPNSTVWTLDHEATFADIWADETYKATGLPNRPPRVALIHPHNPAVVYFFLRGHLFAVDLPARKVLECDRYHLVAPPLNYPTANRFIRAWELLPVVSS
ncbi:LOW QUALITY PROTEIN: hypothetical protein U9M48_038400, partial [Paspalum notatum var. saurae]